MKTQTNLFYKTILGLVFLLLSTLLIAGCQQIPEPQGTDFITSSTPDETLTIPTSTSTTSPTPTPSPSPTPTITSTPTPTVVTYGPSDYPNQINPLTGQAVANPELLARPPIMIKVSNFPS